MSDIWTPPRAHVEDVVPSSNPEAAVIRRRYANHEASVKAMAWLYLLVACLAILPQLPGVIKLAKHGVLYGIFGVALVGGIVALVIWIVRALRQLKPWARIVIGVLAVLSLLDFPVGTAFNGYLLFLLFSPPGNTVFSKAYREVVAQTPEIEGGASLVVFLFAAVYVVLNMIAGLEWLYSTQ